MILYTPRERPADGLTKVIFLLDAAVYKSATEALWAEPVGERVYRLKESPFYVYGFSYNDIVTAYMHPDHKLPVVDELLAASGHSTYRIYSQSEFKPEEFEHFWEPLRQLGCTFQGVNRSFLVVDIPPETDIHRAFHYLQEGERMEYWAFEETHFGHDQIPQF